MKSKTLAIVLCGLSLASPGPQAATVPAASDVPITWDLDIEFDRPRTIRVTLPGESKPSTFWFLRYTVTNSTGADRIFAPELALFTDTGQLLRAGAKVPPQVFDSIKKIYNDPLLKRQSDMVGKLLQGEDNALDGVAIWRDFDPKAGAFDIFIGGLSGDTVVIKLPKPIKVKEVGADGKMQTITRDKIILAKTLRLSYKIPGQADARVHTKPKLVKKEWVMR